MKNLTTLRSAIKHAQSQSTSKFKHLPDKPSTPNQIRLASKHGSPRQFAIDASQAIGDISPAEALQAINAYLAQWNQS